MNGRNAEKVALEENVIPLSMGCGSGGIAPGPALAPAAVLQGHAAARVGSAEQAGRISEPVNAGAVRTREERIHGARWVPQLERPQTGTA